MHAGRASAPAPDAATAPLLGHTGAGASDIWRAFGHVRDARGRRFGYAATFSRFVLEVPGTGRGDALMTSALILVDEQGRQTATATHRERLAGSTLPSRSGKPSIELGGWTLHERDLASHPAFVLSAPAGAFDVELSETALKTPVSLAFRTGSCGACAVNVRAYTRLQARGRIAVHGTAFAVDGIGWLEHEVATRELGAADAGWDRLAISLDDGRDLMIRVGRRRGGAANSAAWGVVVARDGTARTLGPRDFTFENAGGTRWRSPRTGVSYPALWELTVPSAALDLAVVPPVLDQEIAGVREAPWFDGVVDVERAPPPGGDPGTGFVELVGYGRPANL